MIEISSSADLEKLNQTYLERVDAGFTGVLEVRIANGTYVDTNWSLGAPGRGAPPKFDVVLKGTGAAIPGPSKIAAHAITIEGLAITSQKFAPILLETTGRVDISNCAFVEGRLTSAVQPQPYLEIRARGQAGSKTPIKATLDHTWFTRNFQAAEGSSLLAFTIDENEPGYFDELAIRDAAFLGNAFSADVSIAFAKAATIERTVFYKTWPSGVFVRAATSGSVTAHDTVFIGEDAARITAVTDTPPVVMTGSKVVAPSSVDTKALDAAIALPRALPTAEALAAVAKVLGTKVQ